MAQFASFATTSVSAVWAINLMPLPNMRQIAMVAEGGEFTLEAASLIFDLKVESPDIFDLKVELKESAR